MTFFSLLVASSCRSSRSQLSCLGVCLLSGFMAVPQLHLAATMVRTAKGGFPCWRFSTGTGSHDQFRFDHGSDRLRCSILRATRLNHLMQHAARRSGRRRELLIDRCERRPEEFRLRACCQSRRPRHPAEPCDLRHAARPVHPAQSDRCPRHTASISGACSSSLLHRGPSAGRRPIAFHDQRWRRDPSRPARAQFLQPS